MTALFLLLLGIGVLAGGALLVAEYQAHMRRLRTWQVVELRFGRETSEAGVIIVVQRLAGLRAGTVVKLNILAASDGVRHFLGTDQATLEALRGVFRAALPGVRLDPTKHPVLPPALKMGRTVRLGGRLKILRGDELGAASAGLLAAMQPLAKGEHLLLRWTIRPGKAIRTPHTAGDGSSVPGEDQRMLRTKNVGGVVEARGLIAAGAAHPGRAAHLVGRVTAVLRARSTAAGALRSFPRSGNGVRAELGRMPLTRFGMDRYGTSELAGLIGWPIEAPMLPGVRIGTSPVRMPDARIPTAGRVLGVATWPGDDRTIAQPVVGALSHCLYAGPTGYGKSTLMTRTVVQDIAAGRGVVVIDGKGDTVRAILERIPENRAKDVIVLDCADGERFPGVPLFGGGDPGLAADVALSVFAEIWKDSWGPLSERYLRVGLTAVAHDEGGTLADVPYVFTDAGYRRKLMGRIPDPLTRSVLAHYEAMSVEQRAQQLAAPLGKLSSLLARPVVRTVLGQTSSALDFAEILRTRKIVLVSLNPRRVGSGATRLLAAVIVHAVFQAVLGRSGIAERGRRPFMVCIDEPKSLGDLPMPLDTLLEQARGLGVGVTVAPQSLTQLPKHVAQAILTNAATRVAFAQNDADARMLARDLPGVTPEDLQDLGRYEAIARIGLGHGEMAAPVSLRTLPLDKPSRDGQALRVEAERAFGMSTEEVDAAVATRHQTAAGDPGTSGRVGRTRRQS